MNYTAEIIVEGDSTKIKKCFEVEQFKKDRSEFEIEEKGDKAVFKIKAKDSVALRATLNSITKLLTVYEGIENG